MPPDDDINDVRLEEERRGKRPIDLAERRRAFLIRKKFKEAVESRNEEQFREMLIHELGQIPGTPAYARSLKAWKAYHGEE